jgi:hypothetical protein
LSEFFIRATSSSRRRTVRFKSFTSSSVASAIDFARRSICSCEYVCTMPGTLIICMTAFMTRSSCISFITRGSLISFIPCFISVFLRLLMEDGS